MGPRLALYLAQCHHRSYQGYSLTDEVRAASCLAFSQDGSRLLGGVAGQPQVWLWDLTRPGKSAYHRVPHILLGFPQCQGFTLGIINSQREDRPAWHRLGSGLG